ncbi:MAG: hypothetical protein NT007_11910 [Candidatus Kapabacteria bacterium]|nr:hypothetical protein [Candidatus Kapabacteria bacterium]
MRRNDKKLMFSQGSNAGISFQCQSGDSCMRRNDKKLMFSHRLECGNLLPVPIRGFLHAQE